MNRISALLGKVKDGATRERIANWVAAKDWADKPIPYTLTEKAAGHLVSAEAK